MLCPHKYFLYVIFFTVNFFSPVFYETKKERKREKKRDFFTKIIIIFF